MKEKIAMVAGRLGAFRLPLALLLVLIGIWGASAGASTDLASLSVVQYEIQGLDATGQGIGHIEITLPRGFEYVGLAAGSQGAEGLQPQVQGDGSRLLWQGPWAVGTVVRFWVAPPPGAVVPASLPVEGADLEAVLVEPLITAPPDPGANSRAGVAAESVSVSKTVDPDLLEPGDSRWVTYEVVFANNGGEDVVLDWIADTLPADFLFGGMAFGSEVGEPVDGDEPEIVWSAAAVPANGTLTLRYNVRAVDASGDYENTVVAAVGEEQIGPAGATLHIESGQVFLPFVVRKYGEIPGLPLPYQDDFIHNDLPGWEPFTNWPDLSSAYWFWSGDDGVWGLYNYEFDRVEPSYEGYNLTVLNAPGAQLLTDYRVEARIKDIKETNLKKGMAGIWFRGTYQDSGALDGKTVSGYYFYMRLIKEGTDTLYLMRTTPGDPSFASQEVVASVPSPFPLGRKHWYKVSVEVRGSNIQVWFEDDEDGAANPVQVFNWTDPEGTWPSGTVGLATYNTSARYDYINVLP